MGTLTGMCGSKGYCSGNAVVKANVKTPLVETTMNDPAIEIARFRAAQDVYVKKLRELTKEARKSVGSEAAEIFMAYQVIVRDEAFFKNAFARVEKECMSMEYAVDVECKKITALFASMDDDYMKERATDIKNVCNELIQIMMGVDSAFERKMIGKTGVILVADNLTPAETIKLDKNALRGIVTEHGGTTSHTVILAKALCIPAIVGVKSATDVIKDGDFLQIDALKCEIEVNPGTESRENFKRLEHDYGLKRECDARAAGSPAITLDGFHVDVNINSGDPGSISLFDAANCDGIGLFRTEFIYMDSRSYPDEEAQFEIYRNIAERAKGKDVTIRTLDVGGDKKVPYMNLPEEENPFLGYRAIRICLDYKDIFTVQLRAILRASAFGNIKIMFPMIVGMEELLEAKSCVEAEKRRLREENIAFNENIGVGIMVETPAAVMISDKLAKESAFFSVGSNDLIQYTTACDRMNERVQKLYDPCNLSVLRSINLVAENAAKAGIPWDICGEAASEERLIPLWVAMGVNELSVAPGSVGPVKRLIGALNRADMEKELQKVLDFDIIDDVKTHMDKILMKLDI